MNEKENKMMNEEDQSDPPEVFPHSIHTPTQPQGRRPRGFAATHQLGPNTTTTSGHSPSDNPSKGGKREREREKEKERTKLRERHRRAITSRMLAGLRQYGNFPLPARADMNDVLAALARQAGWLVDPDGTTYRPQHHGHHGDASYNNNNCQQSSSRDSLVDVDVDSLLPIHDNTNTNTLSMSMSPTSLDSVVIAPPPDTADTTTSIHSPQTQNQLMQQEDFPSVATPYVPVYVKISSVIINNFCQLVDPESVQQELTDLQSLNVDGVVVQCWWGIVESWTPQKYIWSGYRHLFNIVRHFKLKLQVVMAFHEYAASESGETLITLPQWVLEIGKENPDIFFTDREGRRNTECLSWGIDKERVLQGRTGIEVYFDLMRSFRTEFDDLFAEGIICAVEIGLGPSGELKYPRDLASGAPTMAKSSADDEELRRACEAAIEDTKQKIVMSIRVVKGRGVWGKSGKLGRHMAKPRVLALSTKSKGQRTKAFLRVLKYSTGGVLEPAKLYKLKHLSKVEVIANDPTGCTFTLGFDNLRSQSVAPPQWTMRNIDDRNRLLLCILNICKDVLGRLPKVVGIDVVEMALWAKENKPTVTTTQRSVQDGPVAATVTESDLKVTVEKDLVSQAEEEDMEALLGTYVMGIGEAEAFSERLKRELLALEAANVHAILESEPLIDEVLKGLEASTSCVDDMDEWLGIFNVKLRHMREDIESIETRNNKLEMQSVNNKALIEELDKLVGRLRVPSEYAACLTGGSFDEARMIQNVEACEWLANALRGLEVPHLDPTYANIRAVKEKRAELEKLKTTFVRRASEFLRKYFASLVDFMISDKSYFSQRGQLKRPDHADLRYKCRTYARLLQHLKSLDKNCLGPLRKAYCSSLNLLLRREAREFANELRASTKASRNPTVWLEASTGSSQNVNAADTSTVSEAYAKMLTIFIPLLVDESSFFAHFMCFEVPTLVPLGGVGNGSKSRNNDDDTNDDDLGIMDIDDDDDDGKSGKNSAELTALNESLQDLLDGIQEDFYAVVDWAYKIDPLRCISMHGITERYLSGQKADAAGFVRLLLGDLESRISMQFSRFVDEACHQIERNERNVRQMGVLSYILRFATLATRMEQYIQGQSRDLVDQAYTKFVSIMFVTLEKISQTDPKYADIILLENYAAFQNSLYDLANVVPTLAKFYHQASEAYEQACTRYISTIIYSQFERLFQFARKIEDLMYTITPEEIPFQLGLSKMDLRKMLKASLTGGEKNITMMYKKLQKYLTSEELLPSLWDKCKKEFLDKYESFAQLVAKIYPTETIASVEEMRVLLASM